MNYIKLIFFLNLFFVLINKSYSEAVWEKIATGENGDVMYVDVSSVIKKGDFLYVRGTGNFVVNKLGVSLFDFKTVSEEVFKKGKLVKFSSKTTQNKKQKFCNIKLENNKLIIEGSSYNGIAESNLPVGTWWNHEIIKFSKQISPISGRLLPQKVNILGKKDIIINEKPFKSIHFYFLSDDDRPNDKKN